MKCFSCIFVFIWKLNFWQEYIGRESWSVFATRISFYPPVCLKRYKWSILFLYFLCAVVPSYDVKNGLHLSKVYVGKLGIFFVHHESNWGKKNVALFLHLGYFPTFLKTRVPRILAPCAKHKLCSWMIVMHDGLLEFSRELVQGNESTLWFWNQTEPGLFPALEPAALEQGSLGWQWKAEDAEHGLRSTAQGVSVQCDPSVPDPWDGWAVAWPGAVALCHGHNVVFCITGWNFWSKTNLSDHSFLSNWLQVYWHQSNPWNSWCIASWGVPAAGGFKGGGWGHVQFNSLG